jgi:hypothetical protein
MSNAGRWTVGTSTFVLTISALWFALYLMSGGGNDMGPLATTVLCFIASLFCLIAGIVAARFCNPEK